LNIIENKGKRKTGSPINDWKKILLSRRRKEERSIK